MKDTAFLIISPNGVERIRKQITSLGPYEIAVRLQITVPDHVFDELNVSVNLDIKEEHIIKPDINVELEPA